MPNLFTKLSNFGETLQTKLQDSFADYGEIVAKHPIKIIFFGILIVGLAALGFLRYETESAPIELWSKRSSPFRKEKNFFDENYGPFYRINSVISVAKNEGDDIGTPEVVQEMLRLTKLVNDISVTYKGETVQYKDICSTRYQGSPCLFQTILDYWLPEGDEESGDWNETELYSMDATQIKDRFQKISAKTPLGNNIQTNVVMGGREYFLNTLTKVKAFQTLWLVDGSFDYEEKAKLWESSFANFLKDFKSEHMTIFYSAERSLQDELNNAVNGDLPLIILSYVLMLVYAVIILGDFNLIRSKVVIGSLGIVTIILSLLLGLGISLAIGYEFTPITLQVMPELIVGLGLDNMLVMAAEYYLAKQTLIQNGQKPDITASMRLMMHHVGPSVLLTSITDAVAFACGAISSMPAVRGFCIQAFFCLLSILVLELTLFASLIVLDARRVEANRVDCLPCITLKPKPENSEKKSKCKRIPENFGSILIEKYYVKFLFNTKVRIGVIIFFILLLGGGIYGATQVQQGLGQTDVTPTGSFLETYTNARSKYFGNVGAPVYVVFREGIDYTDYDIQSEIDTLQKNVRADPWTVSPLLSWWNDFSTWCAFIRHTGELVDGKIPKQKFYPWLLEFLNNDTQLGKYYRADVNLFPNNTIKSSRFFTYSRGLNETTDYVNAITSVRNEVFKSSLDAFPYSIFYIYFEQYLALKEEAAKEFGLSFAVIFIILCGLLTNLKAALIIVVIIAMIVVDVLGVMYYWNIDLNALSLVNLLLAVGISVEFCAHIAYRFLRTQETTRVERAKTALIDIGSAVFSGAFCTFLGVITLAGARYPLFRMYLGIVLIGILHGLIFLPVILSLIGPMTIVSEKEIELPKHNSKVENSQKMEDS